jgi:oligoendopeptidase F
MDWEWEKIEPFYRDLENQPLEEKNLADWLRSWSLLSGLVYETYQRLYVQITCHTQDIPAHKRYYRFLDEIFSPAEAAEEKLKEKLLASGLHAQGFEIPLRNLRAETEIFCRSNLPLLAKELKLSAGRSLYSSFRLPGETLIDRCASAPGDFPPSAGCRIAMQSTHYGKSY